MSLDDRIRRIAGDLPFALSGMGMKGSFEVEEKEGWALLERVKLDGRMSSSTLKPFIDRALFSWLGE